MKKIITLIIVTFFTSEFCYGQNSYLYSKPKELKDGWNTNDLKSLNINPILVNKMFSQLKNRKNKIQSVLLVENGQIIIEEYLNGQTQEQKHDLRSVTKNIRSILLGIAIDKGFIANVNDPITKYLKKPKAKKNRDKRKGKIKIKHLLTMSSGLDCNDWDKKSKGQEDKIYKKRNWLQYAIDLPMDNEPGTVSYYCSIGTVMIAEIISQASGMTIDEFAKQYLFNPLGIHNVSWGHTSKKRVIQSAKRLYMTSRDMAKIGQLILNKGQWNAQQIVSKKWIEESTSIKTKVAKIDYGYLWWTIPFKVNEKTFISKVATGNGGQYIFIFPELDIVAVFTGSAYNSQEDMLPFNALNDILLPTFITNLKSQP